MTKIEMLKTGASIVVSVGVGGIVSNTVKATTPFMIGPIKKGCIMVGSFVLSSMITEKAIHHTQNKIDKTVKRIKHMVENGELED